MSEIPYQEIYSRMDINTALSELNPIERADRYVVECPECNKKEAYIYKGTSWINCNRQNKCGYSGSLWDYIQTRDSLDSQNTLLKLGELSGVEIPKSNNFDPEAYKKTREDSQLREDALSYFVKCLDIDEAKETLDYLQDKRGFTTDEVKTLELGYINSQNKLFKHLKSNKDYSVNRINEVIRFKDNIGKTHKLVIPFRDSIGNLKGFTFRAIEEGTEPKYLYSTGLKKGELLFNLRGRARANDLIIVEGLFDALTPSIKGIDNIVALGGNSLNDFQIDLAIKHGTKTITICLDNNEAGTKGTKSAIERLKDKDIRVYIAELPDGIKDPDELIMERDIETFKKAMDNALLYCEYQLKQIVNKYADPEKQTHLTSKELDNFTKEIEDLRVSITDPKDINIFNNAFKPVREALGIPEELFNDIVEKLQYDKNKEAKRESLKKLLNETSKIEDPDKAIELLETHTKEIKAKDSGAEFSKLLIPIKESEVRERQSSKDLGVNSGLKINDEDLIYPSGAISIITAPTNHGKTSFLINSALNLADSYLKNDIDSQVHYFSYEEDEDSILFRFLSTRLNSELSANNKRSIRSYFRGDKQYLGDNIKQFEIQKDYFFNSFIDTNRLNIHYVSYSSNKLIDSIYYLANKVNIGAIYIDYMQLLNTDKGRFNTRQEELKKICLDLKDLAVETGLPIILGAQFNREVTSPLLLHPTKIREAGDIEQVSNLIIGFWNNNFKALNPSGSDKVEIEKNELLKGDSSLYVKILKNREGITGLEDRLEFNGNTGKISNNKTQKSDLL